MKFKRVALLMMIAILCTACGNQDVVFEVNESMIQSEEQVSSSELDSPERENGSEEVETEVPESQGQSSEAETETVEESETQTEESALIAETEESKEPDAVISTEETTVPDEEKEPEETVSSEQGSLESESSDKVEESTEQKEAEETEAPAEPESKPQETVHTHSYSVSSETAATCTSEGTRVYKCSCGDTYSESIEQPGHNYVKETVDATCIKDGYSKTYCSMCGTVQSESTITATGKHNYSSTVTTAATCSAEGVMTYTCNGCGNSYTENIAKTGHNYTTETVAASCETNGYSKTYCSMCGTVQSESVIAATGHDLYETWFIYPTCSGKGDGHRMKCHNCDYKEVLPVGALGCLADEGTVYRPGTCTRPAKLEHHCVRCGCDMPDSVGSIDPNNHDWAIDQETGIEFCAECGIIR